MNIRRKHIRSIVERLLAETGSAAPPVDVYKIAERLGAAIIEAPHEDDNLSGFLLRDPSSKKPIIGVNKTHSTTRRRFTIAHEIGHLLLHSFNSIHVDNTGYGAGYGQLKLRNQDSSLGANSEEIEANFFAAELLMPYELLVEELKKYPNLDVLDSTNFERAIKQIATKFKVSPQSANIRLVQLDLLHVGF